MSQNPEKLKLKAKTLVGWCYHVAFFFSKNEQNI